MWNPIAKVYDPLKVGSIDGTDTEPHDRGIVRALNSTYTPNRNIKGRPECTLFVARLDRKTTEETLRDIFSAYGRIVKCTIVRDIVTGASRGYAFIEFEAESSTIEAYNRAVNKIIDDRRVLVDYECERLLPGWKPRRLGGGFGGKKESGQLRFGRRDRPFRKPIVPLVNRPPIDTRDRERRDDEPWRPSSSRFERRPSNRSPRR